MDKYQGTEPNTLISITVVQCHENQLCMYFGQTGIHFIASWTGNIQTVATVYDDVSYYWLLNSKIFYWCKKCSLLSKAMIKKVENIGKNFNLKNIYGKELCWMDTN